MRYFSSCEYDLTERLLFFFEMGMGVVFTILALYFCDRYEAHTYNFPLCPMAFGPVDPCVVWQVGAQCAA